LKLEESCILITFHCPGHIDLKSLDICSSKEVSCGQLSWVPRGGGKTQYLLFSNIFFVNKWVVIGTPKGFRVDERDLLAVEFLIEVCRN
jgi:hypothetical protein